MMRFVVRLFLLLLPLGSLAQDMPALVAKEHALLKYFDEFDTDRLKGSRADSVLQRLPKGYTLLQVQPARGLNYEGLLRVTYPGGIWVDLLAERLHYTNPNGMFRKKKVRQFRRETVSAIQVGNNLACIKGCD